MSSTLTCKVCRDPFGEGNKSIAAGDGKYHPDCFVCHQCLEPFPDGSFYTAEDGKLLCEKDYFTLYGDRCARCSELIFDRCVNALDMTWHPEHFTCDLCSKQLAGTSYMKRDGRPYCKDCFGRLKQMDEENARNACPRCKKPILPNEGVYVYNGQKHHASHFHCVVCKKPVEDDFKWHQEKLYCPSDYARATAPLCFVCRKPIYGRSINAMGKIFHLEHFVCTKCEKPFESSSFWEHNGRPYCEQHYNELAGSECSRCYRFTRGRVVAAAGRKWCEDCFSCIGCDKNLGSGSGAKYLEWDSKIMCTKCYDNIPGAIRRKVSAYIQIEMKARKKTAV